MTPMAVELANVAVDRGGRRILDIERLAIAPREVLGVLGRNGSGKTTLLHVLAGLIRPARGRVRHDNLDLTALSAWRRTTLRRRVAYVPQSGEYNADLPLTVREVVAMGCAGPAGLLSRTGAAAHERVSHRLERLGLADLAHRTFRSLSGGEQQKVLLARALVQEPDLLLLDEPAANLDLDWKERLVQLLDALLVDSPMTVVMVSHETALLPVSCSRVALMADGRLLKCGPPADTLTDDALSRLYGCPVRVFSSAGRRHATAAPL